MQHNLEPAVGGRLADIANRCLFVRYFAADISKVCAPHGAPQAPIMDSSVSNVISDTTGDDVQTATLPAALSAPSNVSRRPGCGQPRITRMSSKPQHRLNHLHISC